MRPQPRRRLRTAGGFTGLLDLRHAPQRLRDLRGRVLVVLKLAAEVGLVRAQIEMAVAGEVEKNRLTLAVALASKRLVDRDADGVRGLGRRDDALGARELHRRLEGGQLGYRQRLAHALVVALAHERGPAVILQSVRVRWPRAVAAT